jgi:hypothetical protein
MSIFISFLFLKSENFSYSFESKVLIILLKITLLKSFCLLPFESDIYDRIQLFEDNFRVKRIFVSMYFFNFLDID